MSYRRNIADYVPNYYSELLESIEVLSKENEEIAKLHATIDDLLPQFNVITATWGLREWERICGITTDRTKTIGERRSNVLARIRGAGTITKEHIKNVSDGYYGGETEVIEKNNEYTIVIKFTSSYGVPSNLTDLQSVLREIIPAHLAIDYEFKFVLYSDVNRLFANYAAINKNDLTYGKLRDGEF